MGDPAEANSIGTVLGQRRSEALPIGSAKTNVGHTEPASGLVGLLKAMLALERDLLPPSLHFDTPNPNIAFDELNLAVAAKALPLPRNGAPRFAGINSFGFGGTNVHAVIRDAEHPRQWDSGANRPMPPLVLSAACEPALNQLAEDWRQTLAEASDQAAAELVAAAGLQRERLDHRLVLWEKDRATSAAESASRRIAHLGARLMRKARSSSSLETARNGPGWGCKRWSRMTLWQKASIRPTPFAPPAGRSLKPCADDLADGTVMRKWRSHCIRNPVGAG